MSDHERPLNPRGRADAPRMGAYMARHGLTPDRVLVSTAQRTRETWERLATAWPAPAPAEFEDRLYEARPEAILGVIKETPRAAGTLLVIGHNPGLHEVARLLIASGDVEARERLNEALPTTGLAVIDFAAKTWRGLHAPGGRLERFVTPRSLAAATEA